MQSSQHEQVLQLLITGGFLDPTKLQQARNIISSVAPSPVSGSLEEAAMEYVDKFYPIRGYAMYESDYDYRTDCAKREQVKEHFLAGAAYVKGGEENQDWPPNIWRLGNKEDSHLHGKFAYSYTDSEGLNQHEYPFDTEQDAMNHYVKRFGTPSRPSLDIDKVVEQLREANPYKRHFDQRAYSLDIWYKACDKLKELLNQSK